MKAKPQFVHVMPLQDEAVHVASVWCWCFPTADMAFENGNRVAVHRALDCRKVCEEVTGQMLAGRPWGVFA